MKYAIKILQDEIKSIELTLKQAESINDKRVINISEKRLYELRWAVLALTPNR